MIGLLIVALTVPTVLSIVDILIYSGGYVMLEIINYYYKVFTMTYIIIQMEDPMDLENISVLPDEEELRIKKVS